jgi:hypothetical protein
MIQFPNLIPECNVDTVFVEALGYPNPNHAPSIATVCQILERKKVNQKSIGFIDDDKKKPAYISNFQLVENLGTVKLLKHIGKSQHLVIVSPAMDGFIFECCNDLAISLSKYGLPTGFREFLSKTKSEAIRRDPKFKNLLNTIAQSKHAKITKIRSWIIAHHD